MSNYPDDFTATNHDRAADADDLAAAKRRLCAAFDAFLAEHHADLTTLTNAEDADIDALTEQGADLNGYDWAQVEDMVKTASCDAPEYVPTPTHRWALKEAASIAAE